MAENLNLIKFHKGLLAKVNAEGFTAVKDNFYLAEDARRLYVGLENGKAALLNSAIRVYDKLSELNTDGQYKPAEGDIAFIKADDISNAEVSDVNALIMYSGGKWIQINVDTHYDDTAVRELIATAQSAAEGAAGAAAGAQSTADQALAKAGTNATTINGLNSTVSGHTASIGGLTTRVGDIETAINTGDNSLAKLRQAITDNTTDIGENTTTISNLDTYVKETVEPKAQKGIDDAKTADDKAAAAREVADEAKATADANKLAIEDATTGLGALNTKVGNLASEDTRLAGEITRVEGKVDANTAKFADYYTAEKIDELIDSLTGTGEDGDVTSIAGLKIYVDEQVEDLEGSISEVNSAVSGLKSDLGKLSNVMNFVGVAPLTDGETTYETDTAAIEAYYTSKGLTKEVGDVVICGGLEYVYTEENKWEPFGSAEANTAKFEELTNAVNGLDTRLTTAEGKVGTLETKVGTLETTVSGHGTKIETIETDVEGLKTNVGVATDTAAADGSLHARLKAEIARAEGAENALDGKITAIDTAYKAADANLQTAINGLDTAYKAADTTINGKIDGLTTRLNALDTAETGKVPVLEAGLAAEIARAKKAEGDLDTAYKAADAETKSYIDNALAWGTF